MIGGRGDVVLAHEERGIQYAEESNSDCRSSGADERRRRLRRSRFLFPMYVWLCDGRLPGRDQTGRRFCVAERAAKVVVLPFGKFGASC